MAYEASSFSRTRENEAKMGAYCTDLSHCKDIRKMFIFPDDEVCVLEPCINNGTAVMAVTGAAQNPNIKIFGVELNDAVADATKENPFITEVLKADFTNGVAIKKNSFSFAFGNPPYLAEKDADGEGNIRMERVFLDRIVNYLKIGAVLVWVIPYNAFCEMSYLRLWMRDFDTEAIYKFRGSEYDKFHQIVIVGRRVSRRILINSQISEFVQKWDLANLHDLPTDIEPFISVNPSYEKEIDVFTTRHFDVATVYGYLEAHGLPMDIQSAFDRRVTQKQFSGGTLKRPPIPLKKDSKYLLVTSGFSDGMVGSVEEQNLHMMRGVAEVVEDVRYNSSDDDDYEESKPTTMTVTTRTSVSIRILENNGTITVLE